MKNISQKIADLQLKKERLVKEPYTKFATPLKKEILLKKGPIK